MLLFPNTFFKNAAGAVTGFGTVSYTGTGSAQSITGLGFQPDLVIIFSDAAGVGGSGRVFDSTRGTGKYLNAYSNAAEVNNAQSLTSFDSSGFSVGTATVVNTLGVNYTAVCWKKAASYLDIVGYTGDGANRTIAHALGVAPKLLAAKLRSDANSIAMRDELINNSDYFTWNDSGMDKNTDNTVWNNSAFDSGIFPVGTSNITNNNTSAYICWLFGQLSGKSFFDSYVGNAGSKTVTGVGFLPAAVWLWRRNPGGTENTWLNLSSKKYPMNSSAQLIAQVLTMNSDGFSMNTTNADFNAASTNYDFIAWK